MKIGITLGDPTGIGPEIVAAACAGQADVVIYGDAGLLAQAAEKMGVRPEERDALLAQVVPVTRLAAWSPGTPTEESGRAQIAYLEAAVKEAARPGTELRALVTAPIHKASAIAAGFAFPGHTEYLATQLGAPRVTMMFAGPHMRVALATIHCALSEVPKRLTVEGLTGTIVDLASALARDFGIEKPHVQVAALNPHAGENGHFGDEEARTVRPAIDRARAELATLGVSAEVGGPQVPDAVFRAHLDGRSHGVVALYHDQGLIPVKLVDFEEAVNVTLGLPLVRTSPDHGVAHDLAGTGRARTKSFAAALGLARELATRRSA